MPVYCRLYCEKIGICSVMVFWINYDLRQLIKNIFHLKQNLLIVLKKDQKIRKDAFNQKLDQTLFIEYIFELFIFSIVNPQQNYQGIIELVERYLY